MSFSFLRSPVWIIYFFPILEGYLAQKESKDSWWIESEDFTSKEIYSLDSHTKKRKYPLDITDKIQKYPLPYKGINCPLREVCRQNFFC